MCVVCVWEGGWRGGGGAVNVEEGEGQQGGVCCKGGKGGRRRFREGNVC